MDGTSGRDLSQDPLTPSLSLDVGPLSSSSSSSDDSKQVSSTGARSSLTTSSLSTPSSIPTSDTASATLPTAVVTPSHHRIVSATVERVAGLVRSRSESSQVLQSIVSMTPTSFKTGVSKAPYLLTHAPTSSQHPCCPPIHTLSSHLWILCYIPRMQLFVDTHITVLSTFPLSIQL